MPRIAESSTSRSVCAGPAAPHGTRVTELRSHRAQSTTYGRRVPRPCSLRRDPGSGPRGPALQRTRVLDSGRRGRSGLGGSPRASSALPGQPALHAESHVPGELKLACPRPVRSVPTPRCGSAQPAQSRRRTAGTERAQQVVRVDPRVVSVGPRDANGISPDRREALRADVVGNRRRVEQRHPRGLFDAVRTATRKSDRTHGIQALVAVAPPDPERRRPSLLDVRRSRRTRHGANILSPRAGSSALGRAARGPATHRRSKRAARVPACALAEVHSRTAAKGERACSKRRWRFSAEPATRDSG